MIQNGKGPAPSDAELVAYLDGELTPSDSVRIGQRIAADRATAERLTILMNGARPFREALDPLLGEAPMARLDGILSAVLEADTRAPARAWPVLARYWPAGLAAAIALMVIGAGLDRFVFVRIEGAASASAMRSDESDEWRRVVAEYLSLYTSDTLSIPGDSGAGNGQRLASIGRRLGVDLTAALTAFPDLPLKRAEMLDYEGMPLGFLAYLDPHDGPISLCIVPGAQADTSPRVEQRRGMNVVYWSRGRHSFMLIGHTSVDRLQGLATLVADRFAGGGAGRNADQRG
jgi:anti-sigma factor RsiW